MGAAPPRFHLDLPDYAPDVRFSPDGLMLAAATVRGPVVVIDPARGEERYRTEGHTDGALSVAWSVVHPLLASGGADGVVALVRAKNGEPRARTELGRGWVERLAWSPDGAVLAATMGRSVCFLGPDGALRGRYDGHPSTVTGLAWHTEKRAWITSAYGVVSMFAPSASEPLHTHYFRTSLLSVHPSPDGRFIASGTQDPLVHVWDLDDELNEVNLTGYAGKVNVLAWSPVSPLLATAASAAIVLWDFSFGDPLRTSPREIAIEGGRIGCIEMLRTGELVAGTDRGAVWRITLTRDGAEKERALLAQVAGAVCAIVPSPDGRALLVAATGGRLTLVSLADES